MIDNDWHLKALISFGPVICSVVAYIVSWIRYKHRSEGYRGYEYYKKTWKNKESYYMKEKRKLKPMIDSIIYNLYIIVIYFYIYILYIPIYIH